MPPNSKLGSFLWSMCRAISMVFSEESGVRLGGRGKVVETTAAPGEPSSVT